MGLLTNSQENHAHIKGVFLPCIHAFKSTDIELNRSFQKREFQSLRELLYAVFKLVCMTQFRDIT